MQPLVLDPVTLSKEDYVTINYRLWRRLPGTRRNNWLLALAVLLLTISVGLSWYQTGSYLQLGSSFWFLVVGLLYGISRPLLTRWLLARGYAKNQPVLATPIRYTLTADEIRGESTLGQFSGKWQLIRRATWVHPHWLLLYPTEAACYYLDLRQLQPPGAEPVLAQLLTQHQIPQQHISA